MAIPPSKFFKDLNTTSITPVTNTTTTTAAAAQNPANNTPAALDIPPPSTTPPPAYTRGMPPPGIFHNPYDARSPFPPPGLLYPAFPAPLPNALGLVAAPYASTPSCGDYDDDSEAAETKTIHLHIACPVTVKGSNNRVNVSPVTTATKVAQAVVRAIREASMCQGGVPMIDEDGVPRGVDVKVDAAVMVEGDGNVVGEALAVREDEDAGKGKGREAGREVVVKASVGGKTVVKREREDDAEDGAGRGGSKRVRQA